MKMNSGELMINRQKRKYRSNDDVKKKKKITSLHILKLTKFLQTFFATWLPLGKTAILFSVEGIHKGSKIGKCSKEPSLGVSVTC